MRVIWAASMLISLCTTSVAQDRDDGLGLNIPRSGILSPPMARDDGGDKIDRRAPRPCDGVPIPAMRCPFRFSGATSF